MLARGFDVSYWQRGISFQEAVDAGMDFCYIRASTGEEIDAAYTKHNKQASGVILNGSYHALQSNIPARDQAMTFYQALASGNDFGGLPPAVDVGKVGTTERMVAEFLYEFGKLWEHPVVIYTSRYKWHSLVGKKKEWAANYPLWVAHYDVEIPALPTPWKDWTFWQYGIHEVPFWERKVDVDYFNGTREDLIQFSKDVHELWEPESVLEDMRALLVC